MAATLMELLQPQYVLELMSRLRPNDGQLSRWWGFSPSRYDPENGLQGMTTFNGPATLQGQLRYVTYRIFNYTRTVPVMRAPGTGPDTDTPNPMGAATVICPRFHTKIPLNYEFLNNLSPMVGPNSQIDPMGQSYIAAQTKYLAQKFSNAVELMTVGMMRDSLYAYQSGQSFIPSLIDPATFSTPNLFGYRINFQIPSGQKAQLNWDGNGSIIQTVWSNPDAPIIGNLMSIKAAFIQNSGYPMTDVWINSIMWNNIITNNSVRATAGTSNQPFASYEYDESKGMDGKPYGRFNAVLRGDPTITWHINDEVLALGGQLDPINTQQGTVLTATNYKKIPDNMAIFTAGAAPEIAKLYQCGEPVVENPGMPAVERRGYYFWPEYCTQPAVIELLGLFNGVPALENPLTIWPAVVTGF